MISDPFYKYGLTLIPAWISNHMSSKMWDEITYPFQNFKGYTVEVWEENGEVIPHYTVWSTLVIWYQEIM